MLLIHKTVLLMKKTLSKLETRDNLKYFKISLQQPIQWNVHNLDVLSIF